MYDAALAQLVDPSLRDAGWVLLLRADLSAFRASAQRESAECRLHISTHFIHPFTRSNPSNSSLYPLLSSSPAFPLRPYLDRLLHFSLAQFENSWLCALPGAEGALRTHVGELEDRCGEALDEMERMARKVRREVRGMGVGKGEGEGGGEMMQVMAEAGRLESEGKARKRPAVVPAGSDGR